MKKILLSGSYFFPRFCLILCISATCFISNGQVKFTAASSARQISKNDYLQVQFMVENASDIEGILPPPFKNFVVVSGPNQQSGMSNINGNIKQYVALEFTLKPLTTGKFIIPSATAKVSGKEYKSNTLSVEVNNSSTSNQSGGTSFSPFGNMAMDDPLAAQERGFDDYILRKGENVEEKIKKNLFVKVDVNKTVCYIGEPVVASYKLYTRLKSESNLLKTPSFNGFSVSELGLPDNYALTTEKLNGREYNVYTLRKVQLYPLQPGEFELEPVEVENRVTFIKSEYAAARKDDVFYDMLREFADAATPPEAQETKTIMLQSKLVKIVVKPLPEINKPADFKGAVGNFNMQVQAEKNNLTTDDAGNLKIVISGAGNLQLVNAPTIEWPQGLEGYEPRASENIDKLSIPLKGVKTFVYPFTIASEGSYTIPTVKFSYFDPASGMYKTVNSKPVIITVKKGNGNTHRLRVPAAVVKTADSLMDIFDRNRGLVITGFSMVAALVLLMAAKSKKRKAEKYIAATGSAAVATPSTTIYSDDTLSVAEEKLTMNDPVAFYSALHSSLRKFLSDKLTIPLDELSRKKINERLDKCNVPVGTSLLLSSLLENIEINLYAPVSSTGEMKEDYEKASEFISLLYNLVC
jgi:hypothetical protein